MIIKVSFLAAATIAAFAVSHKNRKQYTPIKPPAKDDSNFQQQQNEGEMEDEEEVAEIVGSKELKSVAEIELLHNLVKELQHRKLRFERKLLELCCLKEEQSYMAHLQRHLDDKSDEIDKLNATIYSLQAERKVLQQDGKQCVLAKKKLEMAEQMIGEMQKKMDCNESNMRGRLLMIEEQVSSFPQDKISVRDAIVEKKLKAVKNVELEVLKMKRRNKELELEKRELAVKLVSAQARISSLTTMTERETISKVEEEISRLRQNNDDLSRQVERLQKNRFDMVQELVYQRWLYACMRFETQNQNSPTCHKSHEKIEIAPLTSNPSFDSPSSHTSSTTLSDEIETTTIDRFSSSNQRSSIKKSGFMQSIKKWGRRSKDDSHATSLSKKGLVRRFSASMVPVKTSILRNRGESTTSSSSPSSKTPSLSRGRRVSFSDSVKPTADYSLPNDKEMKPDQKFDCSSTITMNSIQNYNNESQGETREPASPASPKKLFCEFPSPESIKDDSNITDQVNNFSTETIKTVVPEERNKVDTSIAGFVAALFFLLFILVACILHVK